MKTKEKPNTIPKLNPSKVEYDWKKCDEGKESHPFVSFNGGYTLNHSPHGDGVEEIGYHDYQLANAFMQSDKPFVLRESGGSGNLNGIICRKSDVAEMKRLCSIVDAIDTLEDVLKLYDERKDLKQKPSAFERIVEEAIKTSIKQLQQQ